MRYPLAFFRILRMRKFLCNYQQNEFNLFLHRKKIAVFFSRNKPNNEHITFSKSTVNASGLLTSNLF